MKELSAFYDAHHSACLESLNKGEDHVALIRKFMGKAKDGTLPGTEIRYPRSSDEDETVAWYVGGDNGCLYVVAVSEREGAPRPADNSIRTGL